MITASTAILFFSRSAPLEVAYKSLSKSKRGDFLLVQALEQQTFAAIQRTKLPFFRFDETNQIGATFGERLSNAMQKVYNAGYEKIVVIGNDCPALTAQKILKAAGLLQDNNVVIGPNYNGGCYLIGMHRSTFDAATFSKLPWQKRGLLHELLHAMSTLPLVVEPLADINAVADIAKSICLDHFSKTLKVLVLQFKKGVMQLFIDGKALKNKFIALFSYNKGSPVRVDFCT